MSPCRSAPCRRCSALVTAFLSPERRMSHELSSMICAFFFFFFFFFFFSARPLARVASLVCGILSSGYVQISVLTAVLISMVASCGTAWWLEANAAVSADIGINLLGSAPRRCSGVQVSAVALCEYCGGARLARMLERTDACRDRSSMRCCAQPLGFSLPHFAHSLPLSSHFLVQACCPKAW